jgi:hypothetical protein
MVELAIELEAFKDMVAGYPSMDLFAVLRMERFDPLLRPNMIDSKIR